MLKLNRNNVKTVLSFVCLFKISNSTIKTKSTVLKCVNILYVVLTCFFLIFRYHYVFHGWYEHVQHFDSELSKTSTAQ